jgi:hypothetical protein
MALHELSAFEHIDRIESLVYDALYSDRRPPDPSLGPTAPSAVGTLDGSNQNLAAPMTSRSPQNRKQPREDTGCLNFVDGN